MAKGRYTIIDGKTRKVKKRYAIIDGMTRKIKKRYAVVDGKTRLVWKDGGARFLTGGFVYINSVINSNIYELAKDESVATGFNTSTGTYRLEFLTYGNGLLMMVDGSQQEAYYSTDFGKTWIKTNFTKVNRVKYINNKFYVLHTNGVIHWSNDGFTWNEMIVSSYTHSLKDIAYGGGRYVITTATPGGFYYSFDGDTWTFANLGNGVSYEFLTYNTIQNCFEISSGNQCAYDGYGDRGYAWNTITTSGVGKCVNDKYFIIKSDGVYLGTTLAPITTTAKVNGLSNFTDIIYGDGMYVAVKDNHIYYSYDALNFTEAQLSGHISDNIKLESIVFIPEE